MPLRLFSSSRYSTGCNKIKYMNMVEMGCEPIFLQTKSMHSCSFNCFSKQGISSKPQSSCQKGVEKQLYLHMLDAAATELLCHSVTPCGLWVQGHTWRKKLELNPCGQSLGLDITGHEPAVCPDNPQGQQHSELHPKRSGQQVEGGDSALCPLGALHKPMGF